MTKAGGAPSTDSITSAGAQRASMATIALTAEAYASGADPIRRRRATPPSRARPMNQRPVLRARKDDGRVADSRRELRDLARGAGAAPIGRRRESIGHDADSARRRACYVGRPLQPRVEAGDGAGLLNVERLAARGRLGGIDDEHAVHRLPRCQRLRDRAAEIARADDGSDRHKGYSRMATSYYLRPISDHYGFFNVLER